MTSSLNVVWSPRAVGHLEALRAYIARENPKAASRIAAKILTNVSYLAKFPHLGRPGRIPGTREMVIVETPYILPYRVRKGSIEIIAVFHGYQRWPDL